MTETKSKLAVSNEKRGELEILNDDLTKKVEKIMEEKVEIEENAKKKVSLYIFLFIDFLLLYNISNFNKIKKEKIESSFQLKIIADFQCSNGDYSKKNTSLIAGLKNLEEQAVTIKNENDELRKNLLMVREENAKLEKDVQEKEIIKKTLTQVIKESEQTKTNLQDKVVSWNL